jgi:dihydroflavonol-4-reductase
VTEAAQDHGDRSSGAAVPALDGLALVTGATGFVGAAVAAAVAAAGASVRVLARPGSDRRNLEGLPVVVAEGDLGDPASLGRALAGCRYLFHVAADYRLWVPDERPMLRANVEGTRSIMELALAAGVERILHTSSVAALGHRTDGAPADETAQATVADMVGAYKRSKLLAEEEVRRLVAEQGLPAVIASPAAPMGPGDRKPTPTGRMIIEAAAGRAPAYVDTGLNIVHVHDVAKGHVLALARGRIGERYVLGGDNLSLREVLSLVAVAAGRRPPLFRLPIGGLMPAAAVAEALASVTGRTPFLTRDELRMARTRMFFTSAKAERELGYTHRPAREAIADAVAWYRANGFLR